MNGSLRLIFTAALALGIVGAFLASLRPLLITALISGDVVLPFLFADMSPIIALFLLEVIDALCMVTSGLLLVTFSTGYGRRIRELSIKITLDGMVQADDEVIKTFASRMKTCSEGIEDFYRVSLVPTISAVVTLILAISISVTLSTSLMGLIVLEVFFLIGGTILFSTFYENLAKNKIDVDSKFLSRLDLDRSKSLSILFCGIKQIWKSGRFEDIKSVETSRRKVGHAESAYFVSITFFLGAYVCLGYYILIEIELASRTTFIAFVFYSGLMMVPITRICSFMPEFKNFLVARRSLLLDYKGIPTAMPPNQSSAFHFEALNESLFPPKETRILLTGSSGSGKTTFLLRLIGLYPSKINIDGLQATGMSSTANEYGIFYISEQPFFEPGKIVKSCSVDMDTLRVNNVYYGLFAENDLERIFSQEISSTGSPLSFGERQRLQLLRVLCQKPKVLLMDEALSGVEENLESIILSALFKDQSIRFIIYITHRSSIQSLFSARVAVEKFNQL